MCGIYCVYKQSRSCQLPFCASPIFHFEIGDFSVYIYRDNGGGLALSVYIRKLSFSPSISGQIDSYLHHCDYTIKGTIGLKMGSF